MDRVEVQGLRIGYERAGTGPPLVLLHGYVGDGRATWRHQLDDLADEFTVVAWDAPGAGASSDPPEHWGMSGYAHCLAAFLHTIDVPQANVVGLSFGGALALALYASQPDIALTLTLASAYAGWRGSLPADVAAQRYEQALQLSELGPNDFVDTLLPTMFWQDIAPEDLSAFEATLREFHPIGFRAMARAATEDLRHVLPSIAVPTLLVYGDHDVRAPRYVAEHLRDSIPTASLVVLPDAGHACCLEAPRRFNDAIRTFVHAQHVGE
jgi:pimeloyl-ACP methyl ester carboxylesterase